MSAARLWRHVQRGADTAGRFQKEREVLTGQRRDKQCPVFGVFLGKGTVGTGDAGDKLTLNDNFVRAGIAQLRFQVRIVFKYGARRAADVGHRRRCEAEAGDERGKKSCFHAVIPDAVLTRVEGAALRGRRSDG